MLADPDAVVDDAAEVLDEVAVEISGDRADALVQQHVDARVGGARAARRQRRCCAGEGEADEIAAIHRGVDGSRQYMRPSFVSRRPT